MSQVLFDRFPGGLRKALVMSYDDGTIHDRRLVEIFNRSGIKGTFCLNSGRLDQKGFISAAEVAGLFKGHEVAVHTVTHPCLCHLSHEGMIAEVMDDRKALEQLVGYPVRGMSYPGGDFNQAVLDILPMLGIAYSRTVETRARFSPPDDFLRWPMNCHHNSCLEKGREFLQVPPAWGLQVMLVMGHSYEFAGKDNWHIIEEFCTLMGRQSSIWYATHIEIADYLRAARSIHCSADGSILSNPTSTEVWFTTGYPSADKARSIRPGETVRV